MLKICQWNASVVIMMKSKVRDTRSELGWSLFIKSLVPAFCVHFSFLYVLQLVGRAQGNFHTPPIVVALQTPLYYLSPCCRSLSEARTCERRGDTVSVQRGPSVRCTERGREKKRLSSNWWPIQRGNVTSQFVLLIGGLAEFAHFQSVSLWHDLFSGRRGLSGRTLARQSACVTVCPTLDWRRAWVTFAQHLF